MNDILYLVGGDIDTNKHLSSYIIFQILLIIKTPSLFPF